MRLTVQSVVRQLVDRVSESHQGQAGDAAVANAAVRQLEGLVYLGMVMISTLIVSQSHREQLQSGVLVLLGVLVWLPVSAAAYWLVLLKRER